MLTSAMMVLRGWREAQRHRQLFLHRPRQGRIEVIEHGRGARRRYREIRLNGLFDLRVARLAELLFLGLVPDAHAHQVLAQAQQRLALPLLADDVGVAIARRVVRRRVIAEAIAERFDQRRTVAAPRLVESLQDDLMYSDDVVAVDLPS